VGTPFLTQATVGTGIEVSFGKVLVIQIRHLGDVLLTTPVFQALRRHAPKSTLVACVGEGSESMLTLNPNVDRIEAVPRRQPSTRFLNHWQGEARLLRAIRAARFDLVIDLTANDRTAILAKVSGARTRIAYRRPGFAGKNRLYTSTHPLRTDVHMVQQHLDLLKTLRIGTDGLSLGFHFQEADLVQAQALLGSTQPFVQFHPISRIERKCWPEENVARLIEHISAQGLRAVLTGSGDPLERAGLARITARLQCPFLDLGGRLSLKELGALSSLARCFIGVDTGPMHIAAAVGTPVIALFGPSSERLWHPWCPQHLVLSQDLPCRTPCQRKSACQTIECLRELTPAMVLPQIDAFLSGARTSMARGKAGAVG